MDRPAGLVFLEGQNRWPSAGVGVILDHHSAIDSIDHHACEKAIARQFVVAVLRDHHLAGFNEPPNPVQRFTQA